MFYKYTRKIDIGDLPINYGFLNSSTISEQK